MKMCTGMKVFIKMGLIEVKYEPDFDGKGSATLIQLKGDGSFGSSALIRYCPFCGKKVQNLMIDDTTCDI